jgi:hypothetical protein
MTEDGAQQSVREQQIGGMTQTGRRDRSAGQWPPARGPGAGYEVIPTRGCLGPSAAAHCAAVQPVGRWAQAVRR